MNNKHSAVLGRLFSFLTVVFIAAVCAIFASGCDTSKVSQLFTPNENFQVTFVLNNGEENVVWHSGDVVPEPVKSGYKFVGWYNDVELTGLTDLDFDTLNLSTNIVLYAKWQELEDIEGVLFEDLEVVYDGGEHSLEASNLPQGASVSYDCENVFVNAGTYSVNALVTMPEHKELSLSATLTIKKASVSGIRFLNDSFEWDGKAHGIFIDGTLPSEVSVTYEGNGQREVGEYDVTAHFNVSDNYEPIADMHARLSIEEVYFSICFKNGDGTTIDYEVAHGKGIDTPPTLFQKEGYIASWENVNYSEVYDNVIINAEYTPIEYTIRLQSVGNVVKQIAYTIERGAELGEWSRDYYTFDGWYASSSYVGACVYNIKEGNTGDKTFYAKWTPISYRVSYHLNGGTNGIGNINSDDGCYAFNVESEAFEFSEPFKQNYVFEGWYASSSFSGDRVERLSSGSHANLELYARWSARQYEIVYELCGGENAAENPSTYSCESGQIALLAPAREHYTFVCWQNAQGQRVDRLPSDKLENLKLIAIWSAQKHKIEGFDSDGARLCVYEYSIESEDIELADAQKAYYDFQGWYDNEAFEGERYSKISASSARDIRLYAKFSPIEYRIEYNYRGGECVDNPQCYTVEDELELAFPQRAHYTFIGWFCEGERLEKIVKGTHGSLSLKAHWQAVEYTIEYRGADELSERIDSYTVEDSDIELPIPTRAAYSFVGWYDNAELEGDAISVLSSQRASSIILYAKFEPIRYTITYDCNGGGQTNNPTSYTIESNDIALVGTQRKGYEFKGWYSSSGAAVDKILSGSSGDIALIAYWEAIVYSITYRGVEDAQGFITSYTCDDAEITLPIAQKQYYDFNGWFENAELSGNSISKIATDSARNFELYASFEPTRYSIVYNYNGGSEVDNPTEYTIESADIELKSVTREGYVFVGWYDLSGGKRLDTISKGSHGSLTLEARFEPIEHTITYHNVSDTEGYTTRYSIEGGDISLPQPQRAYYSFDGWFLDENFSGSAVVCIDASLCRDIDVYAKFTPIEYTITYVYNGGTEADNPTSYTYESAEISLNPSTRIGYAFKGWFDENGDLVGKISKGSSGDIRLEAYWRRIEYGIVYHNVDNQDGFVTQYNIDSADIALPTPQRRGYEYSGWYLSADFSGEKISVVRANMACDLNLYAKFTAIEYTIEYAYDGGAEVNNPTSYTVESESITLLPSSKSGYTFLGWYSGADRIDGIEKGSIGSLSLVAKWSKDVYTITYNNVPSAEGFVSTYSPIDDDIVLAAAQRTYYTFGGWYENEALEGESISVIDTSSARNYNLYAKFTPIVYSVTYSLNGGIEVENPSSYTVESQTLTLNATSKAHYDFSGWYFDGKRWDCIPSGSHGDMCLEARFSATSYGISYHNVEESAAFVSEYSIDDNELVLPTPQKSYYNFCGWYDNASLEGESISVLRANVNGSIDLYAKFTPIEYELAYEGVDGVVNGNPRSYTVESEQITLLDVEKSGFEFLGWYDKETDVKVTVIDTSAPKPLTLVAKWNEIIDEVKSEFIVDEQGYIIGIDVGVLGESTVLQVPASIDGVELVGVSSGAFGAIKASVTEIVFENGISSIAADAFLGMSRLQKLVLPSSLAQLHKGMLGELASLSELTVPFASFWVSGQNDTALQRYTSNASGGYAYGFAYLFGNQAASGFSAFVCQRTDVAQGSTGAIAGSFYIPDSLKKVTALGGGLIKKAFNQISTIQSIILQADCDSIGPAAFYGCANLKEVTIKGADTSIGASMFSGCGNLTTVYVATLEQKSVIEAQLGNNAGAKCELIEE